MVQSVSQSSASNAPRFGGLFSSAKQAIGENALNELPEKLQKVIKWLLDEDTFSKSSSREAPAQTGAKPKLIQGSIGQGVKRVVSKFLRLRTIPEVAILHIGYLGLVAKNFLEGFIGAESLYLGRHIRGVRSFKHPEGRSIVSAFKDYFGARKA